MILINLCSEALQPIRRNLGDEMAIVEQAYPEASPENFVALDPNLGDEMAIVEQAYPEASPENFVALEDENIVYAPVELIHRDSPPHQVEFVHAIEEVEVEIENEEDEDNE